MSGIATAIGAAAVGTVAAGAIAAGGAESAAQTQAGAAENAQQISQNEFKTITAQNQPFIQSGYGALNQLDYLLGISPQSSSPTSVGSSPYQPSSSGFGPISGFSQNGISLGGPVQGYDPSSGYRIGPGGSISRLIPGGSSPPAGSAPVQSSTAGGFGSLLTPFTADYMRQYSPAYQFQLQQGLQGVANADTSSLGALSGAAAKDLIGYNQNYANTAFNSAFNQYQTQQGNIYSRLAGIAQLGQSSANNTGQQGTALAGQAAQSATNVGTALAGGTVGAANAISGGVSNLGSLWAAYGGGNPNNNPSNWDTENPSNFQDWTP